MNAAHTISMSFADVDAPTVGLSSPAAIAGPATVFTATAGDNTAISKVDFYVDYVLRGTDNDAPYQFSPDGAFTTTARSTR